MVNTILFYIILITYFFEFEMNTFLNKIQRCKVCIEHLPLGPRPVVQLSAFSKIIIIGQAPGRRVHETGIPWSDASGIKLRDG